jgi:hypothetical protein
MKKHLIFAFLIIVISSSTAFSQINACYNWSVRGIGYSEVLHDDAALRVSGIAGTEFIVYDYTPAFCDHDFDSWVYSELANSSGILSSGRIQRDRWQVEGMHGTYNATFRKYCVTSAHGMVDYWSYDDGKIFQNFTDEYTLAYTQDCYTFVACPLNPSLACPTPTPTPTPNPPTVAITQRTDVIEKNGTKDIKISVTNNASGTTKLNLRATNGTGNAVFDTNNSAELIINGNVTDQIVKIKGTTESSGVDNITVEAKLNTNTAVADHDEFTVATISSLVFEANNSPIDADPGNGQTGSNVGERIFPDKNAPVDPTDRQTVKVKANVLPTALNATVYFATYDLDDPSTSTIIDTNGVIGNDNNGTVITGTSAGLLSGTSCTTSVNRADCSTTSGVSEALLTVTMQPGDNFAIAASLTQDYRNGIILDAANGSRLLDAANNELPITRTTGNNVIGIRTNMLTTWRRLHIEVDSMGNANSNFAIGTITDTTKVRNGTVILNLSVTNLEPNRFENGRLEIRRNGAVYKSLRVVDSTPTVDSNTASSVTIFNNLGVFSVANGDQFTLYDDDDMDDDDGTTIRPLHGDDGEDVAAPHLPNTPDLLSENDIACSNTFNANDCNVFVNAYVRPAFDLTGENIPLFSSNVNEVDIGFYRNTYFQNRGIEASSIFWTVWLFGAYQLENSTGDPDIPPITWGMVDDINGAGATVFTEANRPTEYALTSNPTTRPVAKRFTVAHELGHLFYGLHEDFDNPITPDAGLMAQTGLRSSPLFSDTTINKIRGGLFYDPITMTTRRITHP